MKINFGMSGTAAYLQHRMDMNTKRTAAHEHNPGQSVSFGKQTAPHPNLFSLVSSKDGQGYAQDLQSRAFQSIDRRYGKNLDFKA